MKSSLSLLATLFVLVFSSQAQTPSWVNTLGNSGIEVSGCFDRDASGNVYLCGKFGGTVDVDPGAAVYNLTSNGLFDAFVAKYNAAGNLLWAFNIGGTDVDEVCGVRINNAGEVLITGYFRGAGVDFDPSAGIYVMDGPGQGGTNVGFGGDIFLAKYSSAGNFIWAFSIIGSYSHDKAEDLAVDNNDNIYLVGAVNGTSTYPIDADPGPGVYDIGGVGHGFVAKYSTNANFIWAFNFGLNGLNTGATKIAMDPLDTTFVITGFFRGNNVDFDPGPGIAPFTSNGVEDGVIAKYSLNKTFYWAIPYGGPAVDYASDVKIDSTGAVYVTGIFNGTNVDFNPSAAVNSLTSAGGEDAFMAKYRKNGSYMWANRLGSSADDYGESISQKGNRLLLTGSFQNTVDFDPSASTFNLTSAGAGDIFFGTYDTTGAFICASRVGGPQDEHAYEIKHQSTDSFYVGGIYGSNNMDFDPSAGTLLKTNAGQSDVFIGRYANTFPIVTLSPIAIGDTICPGQSPFLTLQFGAANPGPFNIVLNNGTGNISIPNVSSGVPFSITPAPASTTTYTLVAVSYPTANCTSIQLNTNPTATITVSAAPVVTASAIPTSVCPGNSVTLTGAGAASYSWTGGVNNGVAFIPSATTTYTVTGSNAVGCTATTTIQVVVHPLPTVTANSIPATGQVCIGNPVTLFGTGASTYLWTGGVVDGIAFTPSATATYTVTGIDANSCTNTASITVTVNPKPTVTAQSDTNNVCAGTPVTLTASGASTYTWSGGISNGVPFNPLTSFTYVVTGTDANGCTATTAFPVTVYALPVVNAVASPSVLCEGQSTTLQANGALSYSWSAGVTPGVPFIPSGTSSYTVTGTDANGCTNTSMATVTVNPGLVLTVVPDDPVLCLGDTIQLVASGATAYQWQPTVFMSQGNISNPLFYPNTTTVYTVTGSDASGCSGNTVVTVTVLQDPRLILTKTADAECGNKIIYLSAQGADTYSWSPASMLTQPNAWQTAATINQTTTFTVTAHVGTCDLEDSITVFYYNNEEDAIFIPNAFSPNSDGINDCFRIRHAAHFQKFYLAVYNRWGNLVFETDQPDGCWDGTFKNHTAPSATYYYYIEGDTRCGKVFRKGDVILIR